MNLDSDMEIMDACIREDGNLVFPSLNLGTPLPKKFTSEFVSNWCKAVRDEHERQKLEADAKARASRLDKEFNERVDSNAGDGGASTPPPQENKPSADVSLSDFVTQRKAAVQEALEKLLTDYEEMGKKKLALEMELLQLRRFDAGTEPEGGVTDGPEDAGTSGEAVRSPKGKGRKGGSGKVGQTDAKSG